MVLCGRYKSEFMKLNLLGVKLDNLSKEAWLEQISTLVKSETQGNYLVRPNAEIVTYAQNDPNFKKILNQASLAIPDGVGLILAAKLLNINLKQRYGGPESMLDIVALAEKRNFSVFLLGGKKPVVHQAFENLKSRFKNLKLVGYQDGYFTDNYKVVTLINQLKPNIVFVGLGFPLQEKWIWENREKLNVKLFVCEGGSFDYIAGVSKRAPVFIRKVGLDWLFRLVNEPWRIKRQIRLVKFIFLVLKAKFWA